jgi:hypothetical protein
VRWRRIRRGWSSNKGEWGVFLGGKGNKRGFEEKIIGLEGTEVSLIVKASIVIGGGVVKPGVGK